MDYAKIRYYIPSYVRLDEIDPDTDKLFQDIFENDQLIIPVSEELSEELLDKVRNREIRKIWIQKAHSKWIPRDDALANGKRIIESRSASPIKVQLLDEFEDIQRIEGLQSIIEEYEDQDLDDMTYSTLVSLRQSLKELEQKEDDLEEEMTTIEDSEVRENLLDVISSRNPTLDPDDFPSSVRSFVKNFMEFVSDLRTVKKELFEFILEIEDDKTPEVELEEADKESVFGGTEGKKSIKETENPLVDSYDFAFNMYQPVDQPDAPELIQNFYDQVYDAVKQAIANSRVDDEQVACIRDDLRTLMRSSPEPLWILPEGDSHYDSFFKRGLSRLICFAQVWGDELVENDFRNYFLCLLLLDVGMMEVPETYWLHDGQIEDLTRANIDKHPGYSAEILSQLQLSGDFLNTVKQHHERGNGDGYPASLSSSEWDGLSQKIALCDVWDAVTSERPWREKQNNTTAKETVNQEFKDANQELRERFIHRIGAFPSGSLVKLSGDGTPAIVIRQTEQSEQPKVRPLQLTGRSINGLGSTIDMTENDELEIQPLSSSRVVKWKIRSQCLEKIT